MRAIRTVRTDMNVPPSRKAKVYIVSEKDELLDTFKNTSKVFAVLCGASEVICQKTKDGIDDNAVSAVIANATIYMPLSELVDIEKELERLKKEEKRLEGELKRSKGMLSNEKFISKAPAAKIEEEKAKLEKYEQMMKEVKDRIESLGR